MLERFNIPVRPQRWSGGFRGVGTPHRSSVDSFVTPQSTQSAPGSFARSTGFSTSDPFNQKLPEPSGIVPRYPSGPAERSVNGAEPDNEPYSCADCGLGFGQMHKLNYHKLSGACRGQDRRGRSIQGPNAEGQFKSPQVKSNGGERKHEAPQGGTSTTAQKSRWYCVMCKSSFSAKRNYDDHITTRGHRRRAGLPELESFICSECGAEVNGKSSLDRHIRKKHSSSEELRQESELRIRKKSRVSASDVKWYCETCHYGCKKKSYYIEHLASRRHSRLLGQEHTVSLSCRRCGRGFSLQRNLDRHEREGRCPGLKSTRKDEDKKDEQNDEDEQDGDRDEEGQESEQPRAQASDTSSDDISSVGSSEA